MALYRFSFLTGLLISLIAVILGASHAHAATPGLSITMTPSSTELHAAPGASTSSTFTVVNQGTMSYPILLSVAPYHVEGDSYDPQFTPLPGTTDASSWIRFTDPAPSILGKNTTTTLGYTLAVPKDTAPGGYYAVIFAETNPEAKDGGVTPHNRVGNILYITVDGDVAHKGALQPASPDVPSVIWGTRTDLGMLVNNTGGVHFVTTAHIRVTSLFGRTLFSGRFERYILPQTQRLITTAWEKLPPVGIYKVSRDATIAGSSQALPTKYIVIIQPWIAIVGGLALILLVVLAVKSRKTNVTKDKSSPDAQA